MSEICQLLDVEIPRWQLQVWSSRENLRDVAHFRRRQFEAADSGSADAALAESKQNLVQSLTSVAYQVHGLANSYLSLLDECQLQINELRWTVDKVTRRVDLSQEKRTRLRFGSEGLAQQVLEIPRNRSGVPGIIFPQSRELPKSYQRPGRFDETALDNTGHGVRSNETYRRFGPSGSLTEPRNGPGSSPGSSGGHKARRGPGSSGSGSTVYSTLQRQRSASTNHNTTVVAAPVPQVPASVVSEAQNSQEAYGTLRRLDKTYIYGRFWDKNNGEQTNQNAPEPPIAGRRTSTRFSLAGPPAAVSVPYTQYDSDFEDSDEEPVRRVIAIADYAARRDNQLSFTEGAIIEIFEEYDDGWLKGSLTTNPNVRGLVPSTFIVTMQ